MTVITKSYYTTWSTASPAFIYDAHIENIRFDLKLAAICAFMCSRRVKKKKTTMRSLSPPG